MIDFVLFSFMEFSSDMILVLKIFMLLTIISFVWQHLGKGAIAIVVILGLSWIMLLSPWAWFFETTYIIMTLLMFGVGGILIDFVFAFPGLASGGGGMQPMESQVGSGKDAGARSQRFQQGRERLHPPRPRVPPPV